MTTLYTGTAVNNILVFVRDTNYYRLILIHHLPGYELRIMVLATSGNPDIIGSDRIAKPNNCIQQYLQLDLLK